MSIIAILVLIHLGLSIWSGYLYPENLSWTLDIPIPISVQAGALYAPALVEDQQWWRLFSAAALHGALYHLAPNSLALYVLGTLGETLWRPFHYLFLFFVSALGGSLASLASVEGSVIVGASGAIFGIGTALLLELWQLGDKSPVSKKAWRSLAFQLGLLMFLGLLATGYAEIPIAGFGHLGGACFGALAWCALRAPRGRALGWLALIASSFVLSLGIDGRWRPQLYAKQIGYTEVLLGRPSVAAQYLEKNLTKADPDEINAWAYAKALAGEDLERALLEAHRALALRPGHPEYLDTAGWILCQLGEYAEGQAMINRALQSLPKDEEILDHHRRCNASSLGPGASSPKPGPGGP